MTIEVAQTIQSAGLADATGLAALLLILVGLLIALFVALNLLANRWPARFEKYIEVFLTMTLGPIFGLRRWVQRIVVINTMRRLGIDPTIRELLIGPAIRLAKGDDPQDVWDRVRAAGEAVEKTHGPFPEADLAIARQRVFDAFCLLCDRVGLERPMFKQGAPKPTEGEKP